MIEVKNLTKYYGSKMAIEDVNFQVEKVEIRYPDQIIICEKDTSGGWMMTKPDSAKVKKWQISGLFSNLSGLRAKKFPPATKHLAKYGLKSPQGEVVLYQGGKELCWVQLGKKKGNLVYVGDKLKGKFFMVDAKSAEKLKLKPEEIKEKASQ